jgi:RimJ/RimL family protein N-acetyltransferase
VATSYAFNTLGLTEIQAEVLQRNLASVRLLEKVGFHLSRAVPSGAETDSEACFTYALQFPSRSAA